MTVTNEVFDGKGNVIKSEQVDAPPARVTVFDEINVKKVWLVNETTGKKRELKIDDQNDIFVGKDLIDV